MVRLSLGTTRRHLRHVCPLYRMVRSCENSRRGGLYYHSKMILKDAKVGGAWAWHQDYGYWYQNGVLTRPHERVRRGRSCTNGCFKSSRTRTAGGSTTFCRRSGRGQERVEEMLKRPEHFHVAW